MYCTVHENCHHLIRLSLFNGFTNNISFLWQSTTTSFAKRKLLLWNVSRWALYHSNIKFENINSKLCYTLLLVILDTSSNNKSILAVQFVSNCHSFSGREFYVTELRKHITIDVYGECGQLKCEKQKGSQCYKMAQSKYKFYLAFENAICKD